MRRTACSLALLLFSITAFASTAAAEVWVVPQDYPTLTEAIAGASDFDEILVEPGDYFESITLNKALTIRSTDGAEVTTLQGDGSQPVIRVTGNPLSVTLEGLTITGGQGNYGGGVSVITWGSDASAFTLSKSVVIGNEAVSPGPGVRPAGGGVHVVGPGYVEISDTLIAFNDAGDGAGGGAYITPVSSNAELHLSRNRFEGNNAQDAGGLYVKTTGPSSFFANDFVDNFACYGGGLVLHCQPATAGASACLPVTVEGSLFDSNAAGCGLGSDSAGGALSITPVSLLFEVTILRSTFWGNYATEAGGAIAMNQAGGLSLAIDSSILHNNWAIYGQGSAAQVGSINGTPPLSFSVTYSTLYDLDWYGVVSPIQLTESTGSIDDAPELVDPSNDDFSLERSSPCVDSGNPSAPLDPDGSIIDMGASAYALIDVFRRGDVNGDGSVNFGDVFPLLHALFVKGAPEVPCRDAADVDDSGSVNIGDVTFLLAYLTGGQALTIPAPGTLNPGADPTPDNLGCALYLP
ncbi:MAG: dockerin type I domain-containing protein [Myxococcota bacterium]